MPSTVVPGIGRRVIYKLSGEPLGNVAVMITRIWLVTWWGSAEAHAKENDRLRDEFSWAHVFILIVKYIWNYTTIATAARVELYYYCLYGGI